MGTTTGTMARSSPSPRARRRPARCIVPVPPRDTPRFATCTTPLDRPAIRHLSRAISPNSFPRRGPISAARSGGWCAASEAAPPPRPNAAIRRKIRSTFGAGLARSRRTRCGARFPRTIRNVLCTSTGTRARRRRFDSRLRATFAAAFSPTRWDSGRRSSSSCASSPTSTSPKKRRTSGTRTTTEARISFKARIRNSTETSSFKARIRNLTETSSFKARIRNSTSR